MKIPHGRPDAVARIFGGNQAPCLYGTVKLYCLGKAILVVADLCGLPENRSGFFGMHIHEGTECSGEGFSCTASHYNPVGTAHPKHAGDLVPLLSCSGKAFAAVLTDRFALKEVVGKTVVIHEDADDFTSQPAGNAGEKIACGVIVEI